jgi:hypothetical protein
MRNKSIILSLIITAAVASAVSAQQTVPQVREPKAAVLNGTWITTVTPPAEAGLPSFKLIFTFNADRNLIATGTAGEFPALGNPCQGTWKGTGDNEFVVTYVCLDFDGSLQNTGMDKLRGRLVIDEEKGTLRGTLGLTNFDPDGHEVFSACCASVDGVRLEAESFSEADY